MKRQQRSTLLIGNPNVGKSALFTRLTGRSSTSYNFPGTTTRCLKGRHACTEAACTAETHTLIDAAGMYNLSEDQDLCSLLERTDLLINVIDATNLERNLFLTLQLRRLHVPLIVVLNIWDETRQRGISIDKKRLSQVLRVPVIATVTHTGQGVDELTEAMGKLLHSPSKQAPSFSPAQPSWHEVAAIAKCVQCCSPRKKKFTATFDRLTTSPISGTIIAASILLSTFGLVAFLGSSVEGLIEGALNLTLTPLLLKLNGALYSYPFLQQLFIGYTDGATINYGEAMGMLTSGLFIPLGKVAPVVTIFYFTLGLLEECGYLPRLATLSDALMSRFNLHGLAILPMMLGAGCSVTGIVATRMLSSRAQRIVTSILLSMTIPCTSQTAVTLSLTRSFGFAYVLGIFGTLGLLWYVLGKIFGARYRSGRRGLILELPPLRIPRLRLVLPKLARRLEHFFYDAIPLTLVGIFIVLLSTYLDLFAFVSPNISLAFSKLWGLPVATIPILGMGLFRKEIALSLLSGLALSAPQAFTCALILSILFPCISVYAILYREFGARTFAGMVGLMLLLATITGALSHLILGMF